MSQISSRTNQIYVLYHTFLIVLLSLFVFGKSSLIELKTLYGTVDSSGHADGTENVKFNSPRGIEIVEDHDFIFAYVCDSLNHVIRRIDLGSGDVITYAGQVGVSGNVDGDRLSALLNTPTDIVAASSNLFYIAVPVNNQIKRLDSNSVVTITSSSGFITLPTPEPGSHWPKDATDFLYGSLFYASSLCLWPNGDIYAGGTANLKKYYYDDVAEVWKTINILGTATSSPAAPTDGTIYGTATSTADITSIICDADNHRLIFTDGPFIRQLDISTEVATTLVGSYPPADGEATDNPPQFSNRIGGIEFDVDKEIVIASSTNNRIRKYREDTGEITTLIGYGTNATTVDGIAGIGQINNPYGMKIYNGTVYIADSNAHVIRAMYGDLPDQVSPIPIILSITKNALELQWTRPRSNIAPITHYIIHLISTSIDTAIQVPATSLLYTIEDLEQKTEYTLSVKAVNSRGEGDYSGSVSATTLFECFNIPSDSGTVCNSHGVCTDPDYCSCSTGWGVSGETNCSTPYCYAILATDDSACSGNGTCVEVDSCECITGRGGNECQFPKCQNILSSSPNTCSTHGTCIDIDTCSCDTGYFGDDCSIHSCFGVLANDSNVCNGNGACLDVDTCSCTATYGGPVCESPICFGILSTNAVVCSGHGNCSSPDQCDCASGFIGDNCEIFTCFNFSSLDPYTCSGHGECTSLNECSCDSGWGFDNCSIPICGTIFATNASVCSGHGVCSSPEICDCFEGFTGSFCQFTICFGNSSEGEVCSNYGICEFPDLCNCFPDYYGENCNITQCFSELSNSTSVCSGNGQCIAPQVCKCGPGFEGTNCEFILCYGTPSNNASVCSGHGVCTSPDFCECQTDPIYFGSLCDIPNCFGVFANESNVCSNHGECSSPDNCDCIPGYGGANCEEYLCYDIPSSNVSVCSSHGVCDSPDMCICNTGYSALDCSATSCFGVNSTSNNSCHGHGNCIEPDVCDCDAGYFSVACDQWTCFTISKDDADVCSNHGDCLSSNVCTCDYSYFGASCSIPSCFGVIGNSTSVCSGHGICSGRDTCICTDDYLGTLCDTYFCNGTLWNATNVCNGGICVSFDTCSCPDELYGQFCQYEVEKMPVANIRYSKIIGHCDNLTLDGTRSYGKTFSRLQYTWKCVEGNCTSLNVFLQESLNQTFAHTVTIPSSILDSGTEYVFSLIVSSTDTGQPSVPAFARIFIEANDYIPVISLNVLSVERIVLYQPLTLVASAISSSCDTSSSKLISFMWRQISGRYVTNFMTTLNSIEFPPYSFPPRIEGEDEEHFRFEVTARDNISLRESTATVDVIVEDSPLVCHLYPGSYFSSGAGAILLNSSLSFDPDYAEGTPNYLWSCATCPIKESTSDSWTIDFTDTPNGNHTIHFIYSKGNRSCSTDVTVEVNSSIKGSVIVDTVGSINRNERLIIYASIQNMDVERIEWSEILHNLNLTNITVSRNESTSRNSLALNENVLDIGETYLFKVTVYGTNGIEVYGTAKVTVNIPPQYGGFKVEPMTSSETSIQAVTLFSAYAFEWESMNYPPLQYQFEYLHPNFNTYIILHPFSLSNILKGFEMPISGNILFRLRIRNSLGAETEKFTHHTILPTTRIAEAELAIAKSISRIGTLTDQSILHIKNAVLYFNQNNGSEICDNICIEARASFRTLALEEIKTITGMRNLLSEYEIKHMIQAVYYLTSEASEIEELFISIALPLINDTVCSNAFKDIESFQQIVKIYNTFMERVTSNPNLGNPYSVNKVASSTMVCLSGKIHALHVEGESETVIQTPFYSIFFFKDNLENIIKNSQIWNLKSFSVRMSSSLQTTSVIQSLAFAMIHYLENPYEPIENTLGNEYAITSNVTDIHFYDFDGVSLHPTDLEDPLTFTFTNTYSINETSEFGKLLVGEEAALQSPGGRPYCYFWDDSLQTWLNHGCFPIDGNDIQNDSISCRCIHATPFAIITKYYRIPDNYPPLPSKPFNFTLSIIVASSLFFVLCLLCMLLACILCFCLLISSCCGCLCLRKVNKKAVYSDVEKYHVTPIYDNSELVYPFEGIVNIDNDSSFLLTGDTLSDSDSDIDWDDENSLFSSEGLEGASFITSQSGRSDPHLQNATSRPMYALFS